MTTSTIYPVHIQATLDPPLSRWLWLVKWVLAIPHYVVLAFLWLAFIGASVVAFFAILFTGSYPRRLFAFNVGVLRWTWRVAYYAYGALGTDRYPPFTLADVPDYPARFTVDYPQRLSRGLVLVKWWLLAIPHYLIVAVFAGGGAWLAWRANDWQWTWGGGGLIAVLVLVSAITLAVTGSYPRPLFDVILGMNRWALRVAGYAALMTDAYPPFRLDLGGPDPDSVLTLTEPAGPKPAPSQQQQPQLPTPASAPPDPAPAAWTAGRIVSLVVGALLALGAIGPLIGGAATLWADRTQRDALGYLNSPVVALSTDSRALVSETVNVNPGGPNWAYPRSILGDTRLRFTSESPDRAIFVGIASSADAAAYLSGTDHATVTNAFDADWKTVRHPGTAPAAPQASSRIWVASAAGPGTQTLTWTPRQGDWTIVVMNADAGPGVSVLADAGASAPFLTWVAVGLLVLGALMLLAGVVLIAVPLAR